MEEDRQKISEIFAGIFHNIKANDIDFTKDRTHFENWDSLSHMQLVSEVESQFKVNFEMDEVAQINNLDDLVLLLRKKING